MDGNSLTISILSDVQNGILTVGDNGSIAYQPNEHFFGTDTFGYIITDGIDSSQIATATIQVRATNDHPDAVDDAYFARVDSQLVISADRGVLRNDSDVEDEVLQASLVTQPTNGTMSLSDQGAFTYQPNNGFTGEDTFQYAAIDADGARSVATVKLFVGNAPIRINEFMAVNASTLETRVREEPDDRYRGDVTTPDWVELINRSQSSIDISGFHLTDAPTNTTGWSFPDGTVIPAGGYLLVFLDRIDISDTVLDENGIFHATFKLNALGDYLALTSPDGTVLDEIETYPQQVADVSFGRTDDGFAYQTEPSPGAANGQSSLEGIVEPTTVSLPAGYYSDAIEVSISSPDPTATIKYTIDGSEPTETNGTEYTEPIAIAKTTLLRTRAFAEGMLPSISRTHSYLYLDDVLTQPDNPDGFPDTWGRAGAADYEIDPRIATDTDSEYFDADLRAALQSHDAISIVTDSEHLFDRTTGIYSNPQQQGVAWERPASMELFSSTGDLQFQINAGLRIQGGASRNPNRPKHNMRFLFKEQYGQSKLEFPFFEDSPITTIDTLILRGGNGDSWFHPNSNQQSQAQYIRDQWHKTTQQLMRHTFVPQRYIHLYVNGLYWGFYHTFEKPNASFFAERFGGQPEDYDAIQHQNGIVDGNRDKWNDVVSAVRAAPEADETFEFVQQEVDVPALMEYLLLNFYSGNVDWDQNNWFGGRRREDGKFIFFTWDAERTFLGARDNRTTAVNANQPTDVHRRLYRANPEYRLQFADAAHRLFFNEGLLTPDQASERWQTLADEIELPLTAESARWGDSKRARAPYTADVEWKRELNRLMTTYFPDRTDTVLSQLRNLDLYPEVVAPTFNQHGGNVADGFGLTMTAPDGVIYYTTDGSDVRLKGGQISASARVYENNIPISQDTIVKSRVLMDGEWSALNEAEFLIPATRASSENLRVTEIHYNPAAASVDEIAAGFDDNDDFEFVEIANITDQPIDLAGVTFVSTGEGGVDFDFRFAAADRLGPGEVMLIVEDQHAFEFRYGSDLPIVGEWSGRLSNGGETITILGNNQLIQQLTYDDDWHTTTDGSGPSLEIVDRFDQDSEIWSDSSGWVPSTETGGTPGSLESTPANIPGDSNRDGVFDSSDLVVVFRAAEYEDDIDGNSTFEEGDWNGDGDFNTTDLVFAFQAGTYVAELRPIFAADVDAEFASRKQRDRVFSQFAWIEEDDSENDTFADYS